MLSTTTPPKHRKKKTFSTVFNHSPISVSAGGATTASAGISFSFKKGGSSGPVRATHTAVALNMTKAAATNAIGSSIIISSSSCTYSGMSSRSTSSIKHNSSATAMRTGLAVMSTSFALGGRQQQQEKAPPSPPSLFTLSGGQARPSPPTTPELMLPGPARTSTKTQQRLQFEQQQQQQQQQQQYGTAPAFLLGDEDDTDLMAYLEAHPLTPDDLNFLSPARLVPSFSPRSMKKEASIMAAAIAAAAAAAAPLAINTSTAYSNTKSPYASDLTDTSRRSSSSSSSTTSGGFNSQAPTPCSTKNGKPPIFSRSISSSSCSSTSSSSSSFSATTSSNSSSSTITGTKKNTGKTTTRKTSTRKAKAPASPPPRRRFVSSPFEVVKLLDCGDDEEEDATDNEKERSTRPRVRSSRASTTSSSSSSSSSSTSSASSSPMMRCCFSFKDWDERLQSPSLATSSSSSSKMRAKTTTSTTSQVAKRTKKNVTATAMAPAKGTTAAAATVTTTKPKTSGRTTKNKAKATAAAAAAAAAVTPAQQAELDLVAPCRETLTFPAPVISIPTLGMHANPPRLAPLVVEVPHPLLPLAVGSLGSYESGATTMEGENEEEGDGQYLGEEDEALSNSALDILMYAFSSDGMGDSDLLGEVPVVSQEIQAAGGLFFEAADESARDGYGNYNPGCHTSSVSTFLANQG